MDILASILAYLGCVTGIVGALAISAFVFFATPEQIAALSDNPTVATKVGGAGAAKAVTVAEAKSPPKMASRIAPAGSRTTDAAQTQQAQAQRMMVAMSARRRAQNPRAQRLRRLVQEERAKRWAYQQDPDFETRFLGYAD